MKKHVSLIVAAAMVLTLSGTASANPNGGGYRGGGGGYYHGGGYYRGGGWGGYRGGYGWYGTGVPNGLGWAMFGLGAAGALAGAYSYAYPYYAYPAYTTYPAPVYQVPQQVPQRVVVHHVERDAVLAKAQAKLAGMGYYKGGVDGVYGPQTALAVTQFQAGNNLPVSGRLDLKTLAALGVTQ
jgi:hypothetical protein